MTTLNSFVFTSEASAAAHAARLAKVQAWKDNADLKRDFSDAGYWRKLAAYYGVRLPPWYVPGSELKYLRRAVAQTGLTQEMLRDGFGGGVRLLQQNNPNWPAFALVGLLLELAEANGIQPQQ